MTALAEGTSTMAPPPDGRPARKPGGVKRAIQYAVLAVLTLLFLSPLIWMAVTSFKTQADAIDPNPQWIPANPTTGAYDQLLGADDTPVLRWFLNSVLAATGQAALVVATAALAAYALARMDFVGKKLIFGTIVATLFVPAVILVIPNYVLVSRFSIRPAFFSTVSPPSTTATPDES